MLHWNSGEGSHYGLDDPVFELRQGAGYLALPQNVQGPGAHSTFYREFYVLLTVHPCI